VSGLAINRSSRTAKPWKLTVTERTEEYGIP
jgi:hypothetical protein